MLVRIVRDSATMEVESLECNLFYLHMRNKRKTVMKNAAAEKMVLCVPQNCSLEQETPSRSDEGALCPTAVCAVLYSSTDTTCACFPSRVGVATLS